MFVLAHLSDLHLSVRPRLRELAGKRGLGFINWHRGRKYIHRRQTLDTITHDLKGQAIDHIAVTGDLVNLSLAGEYARARGWLESLGAANNVTVVPGNHNVYVPEVVQAPARYWGDYMRGDDGTAVGAFPFERRRGSVALIGLSSAVPTSAFLATGELGEAQLARFAALLDESRGLFRVVLIHHPPVSPPERYLRRLTDAAEFRRVIAEHGAELILHGHDHCRSLVRLDGPQKPVPAIGVPSASAQAPHGHENAGGYNLFRIDGEPGRWRCEFIARQLDADGSVREIERQTLP